VPNLDVEFLDSPASLWQVESEPHRRLSRSRILEAILAGELGVVVTPAARRSFIVEVDLDIGGVRCHWRFIAPGQFAGEQNVLSRSLKAVDQFEHIFSAWVLKVRCE